MTMTAQKAPMENCRYCGVPYPKPVSYHHSTEECRANEARISPDAIRVATGDLDALDTDELLDDAKVMAKELVRLALAMRDSLPQEFVQNDSEASEQAAAAIALLAMLAETAPIQRWKEYEDRGEQRIACFIDVETAKKVAEFFAISESGANWESAAKAMTKHAEALQAKIDRLMLEHCPEEMTPEQIANWERHQRAATPEEEAALQRALTAPSPSGVEEG